jgi:hypothetical protein
MRAPRLVLFALMVPISCSTPKQENWVSITIDGKAAPGFTLLMEDGRVTGGYDGCNGWGLSFQRGLVVSDSQECPEDPVRTAYWSLARSNGVSYVREGDKLTIRSAKHFGVFKPLNVRFPPKPAATDFDPLPAAPSLRQTRIVSPLTDRPSRNRTGASSRPFVRIADIEDQPWNGGPSPRRNRIS